jgi:sugar phosphate isomerase/epimerase
MKLSINQITTSPLGLKEAVDLYASRGVQGISVWEDRVRSFGIAQAKSLVRDAGLEVSGFCIVGLFSKLGRGNRHAQIDAARASIDLAAELGAPCAVTVVGGLLEGERDIEEARKFCFDALAEVLEHARSANLPLALEPLHPMYTPDWSVVSTIAQANEWCDRLGTGIGLAIDTYHTWWDPAAEAGVRQAGTTNRILTFHINDWMPQTKHLLLDRGIPGDGVIDLPWFLDLICDCGYDDWMEVEIFSETLWAGDQGKLVDDILRATRPLLSRVKPSAAKV